MALTVSYGLKIDLHFFLYVGYERFRSLSSILPFKEKNLLTIVLSPILKLFTLMQLKKFCLLLTIIWLLRSIQFFDGRAALNNLKSSRAFLYWAICDGVDWLHFLWISSKEIKLFEKGIDKRSALADADNSICFEFFLYETLFCFVKKISVLKASRRVRKVFILSTLVWLLYLCYTTTTALPPQHCHHSFSSPFDYLHSC